ncbi:Tetraspanin-10 [Nymphaea thermarum]|nr:Tetraspanin-10 [Nymphaea thermarum]
MCIPVKKLVAGLSGGGGFLGGGGSCRNQMTLKVSLLYLLVKGKLMVWVEDGDMAEELHGMGVVHNILPSYLIYKEYQLSEYSSLFKKQLNNKHYWEHLKSCLVRPDDCKNLAKEYKMLKQYKAAILTPIEAGCCRPPSECGFPAINASFYDLSFHPVSTNKDCKIYKNSVARKCYDCDSCKAGVAEYMKTKWKVVAIFNVILFVVLAAIYMVGCCARRNASRVRSDKS